MWIHSEAIDTIAVFQTVSTLSYMFQKKEGDDYDFWDWGQGTDFLFLSKSAPFCDMEPTSNCRS